ncbi:MULTISPECIES: hypothetical protein [Actinomycetes]|uniref:hypothetical protein n=1 Tax=Actinomycetes TaxID=1760 RepID=UPI0035D827B3
MSEIRSQATPATDELVHILAGAVLDNPGGIGTLPQHAADRLLAAGWSKPRTVNSAAELDALPIGSVLARNLDDPDGIDVYVKRSDLAGHRYLPTPLVVLFTPGDAG